MEFSQCPCDVAVNRLKACRQTKTSGEYFLPTMYLPFLLPCLPIPLTHTHTHTHTQMQLPTFCDKTPSSPCLLQVTKAFTF